MGSRHSAIFETLEMLYLFEYGERLGLRADDTIDEDWLNRIDRSFSQDVNLVLGRFSTWRSEVLTESKASDPRINQLYQLELFIRNDLNDGSLLIAAEGDITELDTICRKKEDEIRLILKKDFKFRAEQKIAKGATELTEEQFNGIRSKNIKALFEEVEGRYRLLTGAALDEALEQVVNEFLYGQETRPVERTIESYKNKFLAKSNFQKKYLEAKKGVREREWEDVFHFKQLRAINIQFEGQGTFSQAEFQAFIADSDNQTKMNIDNITYIGKDSKPVSSTEDVDFNEISEYEIEFSSESKVRVNAEKNTFTLVNDKSIKTAFHLLQCGLASGQSDFDVSSIKDKEVLNNLYMVKLFMREHQNVEVHFYGIDPSVIKTAQDAYMDKSSLLAVEFEVPESQITLASPST